jgi:hypothetical protein
MRKLREAGKPTQLATVRELRASSSDRSRRKGDLKVDELNADGRQTLLDVGITYPLIDTYITNKSTVERGFAANKYGSRKDKDYNAIISAKNLDLHYQSVTFGTFGSFGTGTWSVITKACDPASHPKAVDDDNPWNAPGPKRDFMLSLGFALQRANSRMLRNADRRRRSARMSGKYSSGTHPLSSDDDY